MDKKEFIRSPLILTAICFVMTAVLVLTYQFTLPYIQASREAAAIESRSAVFPAADDFQLYEGEISVEGAEEIYFAYANGEQLGCVVTTVVKGFEKGYTVMTGIDLSGEITGVEVTAHGETPGLGTKTIAATYTGQYIGKTADSYADVDTITGATISSNALKTSVGLALQAGLAALEVSE